MSTVDAITTSALDLSAPLDLSVKASNSGEENSWSGGGVGKLEEASPSAASPLSTDGIESLCQLASLQQRFMSESSDTPNYADQLNKVTNGPTVAPPPLLHHHQPPVAPAAPSSSSSSSSSASSPSSASLYAMNSYYQKLVSTYWSSCDWAALYRTMPLQYQLWNNAYTAALGRSLLTVAATGSEDAGETAELSTTVERRLNSHSCFAETALPSVIATPANSAPHPETLGISLRGNQKYSAYYQRPFLFPLNNNSTKRSELSGSSSLPKKSTSGGYELSASSTTGAAEEKAKPAQKTKETSFVCSCGDEFENLYIFTLHMKESNHSPKSSRTERDIPKLVRGQDMWINSETEQTREILCCMRCKQSFRTLPDLTMHMIKTNHYSEIVYSDSGRCVFVNSENSATATGGGGKRTAEKRPVPPGSTGGISTLLTASSGRYTSTDGSPAKKLAKLKKDLSPLPPKINGKISPSLEISTTSAVAACSQGKVKQTEVTEADSATADSLLTVDCRSDASSPDDTYPLTSMIRQIESFVEKNLSKSPGVNGKHKQAAADTDSAAIAVPPTNNNNNNSPTSSVGSDNVLPLPSFPSGVVPEKLAYVAPDLDTNVNENPLSSLQKLVDITHKAPPGRSGTSEQQTVNGTTNKHHHLLPLSLEDGNCELAGADKSPANSNPTVIMVNPTYIYQPPFPSLAPPPYTFPPWYSSLGLALPASGAAGDNRGSSESPPKDISESSSAATGADDARSNYKSGEVVVQEASATGNAAVSKKAKCHFCGKPFANKGQVRLHISKAKCPSLLQGCRNSTDATSFLTAASGAAAATFPYLSLDFIDRLSSNADSNLAVAEDRLKLFHALSKRLAVRERVFD